MMGGRGAVCRLGRLHFVPVRVVVFVRSQLPKARVLDARAAAPSSLLAHSTCGIARQTSFNVLHKLYRPAYPHHHPLHSTQTDFAMALKPITGVCEAIERLRALCGPL